MKSLMIHFSLWSLLTTSLFAAGASNSSQSATRSTPQTAMDYPDLPVGITSFGAAIIDDSVYVYGGHMGRAHHYYREGQSNKLLRLNLESLGKWEEVATGPRLQGLAMVAHDGILYRLGGFTARNSEDEERDLWSVPDFARFDPRVGKWEALPAMPVPRSSFDAVVVGDRIYIAGGWSLRGDGETTWLDAAFFVDLSQPKLTWTPLPAQPFKRRAVSLGAVDGKVYVIGGMTEDDGPTTKVAVFDIKTNTWRAAPRLIGEGMAGFGSSAFAISGSLYVSTYDGNLQKLTPSGWEIITKLDDARFFHRMLPVGTDQLLLVGGANMESGKFLNIELARVK